MDTNVRIGSGLESEFQNLHELVKAARGKLPPRIWDYLVGAAETETTMRRNRHSLDSIAFRPRVLRDVSTFDASRRFLGKTLRLPVLLAPIGSLESFDPGAGVTVARAAERAGVGMLLSSVTTLEIESVGKAAGGFKIFQLYVRGDDAWIDERVKRAVDSGYDAFCITVDTAVYSRRERDIARRFVKPWRQNLSGTNFQAALSWKNIEHFKKTHGIPLLLKGIATAEDAEIACQHGVDVIYVSNHGGRQLDHGRGIMEVLPEVLDTVKGRARVVVDGGFSRGSDVVKAIALGVDAVGIGRLFCYGLAAAGEAGVVRAMELLEDEMRSCMGLLGVTRLDELGRSCLRAATPVAPPHVHSAFPLLGEGY
jgi:glycolate oxidase